MTIIKETYEFKSDVKKVWDTVTAIDFQGDVRVNISEPYTRYELHAEGENTKNIWLFIFEEDGDGCSLTIVANVEAARAASVPFVKKSAKEQMEAIATYICDALRERKPDNGNKNAYSGFNNMSLCIVIGVAFGIIFDNIALGICGGAVLGVLMGAIKR